MYPSCLLLICALILLSGKPPFVAASASTKTFQGTATETKKRGKETFFRSFLNAAGLVTAGSKTRGPPHATPGSFTDETKYVGLGGTGAAVAVGDFNRDRLPDLLMLNTDTYRGVSVQFWDPQQFRFVHRGLGASLRGTQLSKIVSTIAADFNNDGILDVLLTDDKQGIVYFGDGAGNFNLSKPLILKEVPAFAAVVDADADLIPEIFVAFSNGTRGYWDFISQSPTSTSVKFRTWNAGSGLCAVVSGSSIATTDLDGDCQAEFVIPTSCGLEVWKSPTTDTPLWAMKAPHDLRLLDTNVFNSAQQDADVVFDDFDGDGTIDIGVTNTAREDFVVHLNIQKPRKEGLLCIGDPQWRLVRKLGVRTGQFRVTRQRVGRLLHGHNLPPMVHVGDFDSDGNADVLIVDSSSGKPMLFRNGGRWRDTNHHAHRTYEHLHRVDSKQAAALGGGDAVTAAFFDTDGSGRADILVVRRDNDTRLAWNGMQRDTDALFFRGIALSGLPYRGNPKPFAPVPGATFKVSYSSRLTSRRVTRVCSQCAQSGHWRLRSCDCVLALAHIANYIEEMTLGNGGFQRTWTNLMPNSVAVVWSEAGERAARWHKDYFTQRRSGPMFHVVAVLAVALAALAVAIWILQDGERKEDIEENLMLRSQLFHFGGR